MNIISEKLFRAKKKHNGLAIMATGYSINSISKQQWNRIHAEYDTFGINWFCMSGIPTTWYLIREQACKPLRQCESQGYTIDNFYNLMAKYKSSCKIVKDTGYRADHYHYYEHLDKITGDGLVFKEPPRARYADVFCDDIFTTGIHHGKCTIYEPLHFAVQMEYERILLCGVDLYDNRYFYFDYDETLEQLKGVGHTCDSEHLTLGNTLAVIDSMKRYWPGIDLRVQNPKSVLTALIEIWQ